MQSASCRAHCLKDPAPVLVLDSSGANGRRRLATLTFDDVQGQIDRRGHTAGGEDVAVPPSPAGFAPRPGRPRTDGS